MKPDTCRYFNGTMNNVCAARERFAKAVPLIQRIKQEHRGQSWSGVEECPACHGCLRLSIAASNGHVWGKCQTAGCLAWME